MLPIVASDSKEMLSRSRGGIEKILQDLNTLNHESVFIHSLFGRKAIRELGKAKTTDKGTKPRE